MHDKKRGQVVSEARRQPSINVCADGRCDSVGHSALHGVVSMMDVNTNLILASQLIKVSIGYDSRLYEQDTKICLLCYFISQQRLPAPMLWSWKV